MDSRVSELRLMHWKEIITECNNSGMQKKQWMELNNINFKAFYRYQKKIREYELERMKPAKPNEYHPVPTGMQFADVTAELQRTDGTQSNCSRPDLKEDLHPEMMIQTGQYNLYIGKGIHEETLATVLKVIQYA